MHQEMLAMLIAPKSSIVSMGIPYFNLLLNCFVFLGPVCFLEFTFRETTFQTFLRLFAFQKVSQRKTLSGQRKTLSSQRKIWLGFQENVFRKFWAENTFRKL